MKYSLSFLYSLILKDGYKVIQTHMRGNLFELTVEHPNTGVQWVIKLEPEVEDSVQNVMYQIQSKGNIDFSKIGKITGPITVNGKKWQ
jgi:hypothetical protein